MQDMVEKANDMDVASDSDSENEVIEVTEGRPEEKWDCESILCKSSLLP